MMLKSDIDRICSETLRGRFGPSLVSLRRHDDQTYRSAHHAAAAVTLRNVAVWTSARSGFEQGKS